MDIQKSELTQKLQDMLNKAPEVIIESPPLPMADRIEGYCGAPVQTQRKLSGHKRNNALVLGDAELVIDVALISVADVKGGKALVR